MTQYDWPKIWIWTGALSGCALAWFGIGTLAHMAWLSVRNCIYNQIMAAIEVNDSGEITARLETRKKFRRQWTAAWRKIRGKPTDTGSVT